MLESIMQVISVLTEEALHQIILDTGAVIQGISQFACSFLEKLLILIIFKYLLNVFLYNYYLYINIV